MHVFTLQVGGNFVLNSIRSIVSEIGGKTLFKANQSV